MFGHRWGATVLLAVSHRDGKPAPWPAWDNDRATRVRETCRAMVAPLAHSLPERRDDRLVEAFAMICAEAAAEAYATLRIDDARILVDEHDRRFPNWRRDLPRSRSG